ncbi:MAG: hypothetical protein ACUVTL_10820 [Thermoproteota archaeon]
MIPKGKSYQVFYTNEFQYAILKTARMHGSGGKLAGVGGGVFTLAPLRR